MHWVRGRSPFYHKADTYRQINTAPFTPAVCVKNHMEETHKEKSRKTPTCPTVWPQTTNFKYKALNILILLLQFHNLYPQSCSFFNNSLCLCPSQWERGDMWTPLELLAVFDILQKHCMQFLEYFMAIDECKKSVFVTVLV